MQDKFQNVEDNPLNIGQKMTLLWLYFMLVLVPRDDCSVSSSLNTLVRASLTEPPNLFFLCLPTKKYMKGLAPLLKTVQYVLVKKKAKADILFVNDLKKSKDHSNLIGATEMRKTITVSIMAM